MHNEALNRDLLCLSSLKLSGMLKFATWMYSLPRYTVNEYHLDPQAKRKGLFWRLNVAQYCNLWRVRRCRLEVTREGQDQTNWGIRFMQSQRSVILQELFILEGELMGSQVKRDESCTLINQLLMMLAHKPSLWSPSHPILFHDILCYRLSFFVTSAWDLILWILHFLLHLQLLLTLPELSSTVRVSGCWESADVFGKAHLVQYYHRWCWKLKLILEPRIRNS